MSRLWNLEAVSARRILGGFSAITILGAVATAIAAIAVGRKIPHSLTVEMFLIAALLAAIAIASFMVDRDGRRPAHW